MYATRAKALEKSAEKRSDRGDRGDKAGRGGSDGPDHAVRDDPGKHRGRVGPGRQTRRSDRSARARPERTPRSGLMAS
jgi:hypothetical protein